MGYPIYHSAYTAAQIEASLGKTPRINATTRTWEIWDIATSAYVDTGVSIDTQLFVDPTLTQSGYAADAKATGDELTDLNNHLNGAFENTISGSFAEAVTSTIVPYSIIKGVTYTITMSAATSVKLVAFINYDDENDQVVINETSTGKTASFVAAGNGGVLRFTTGGAASYQVTTADAIIPTVERLDELEKDVIYQTSGTRAGNTSIFFSIKAGETYTIDVSITNEAVTRVIIYTCNESNTLIESVFDEYGVSFHETFTATSDAPRIRIESSSAYSFSIKRNKTIAGNYEAIQSILPASIAVSAQETISTLNTTYTFDLDLICEKGDLCNLEIVKQEDASINDFKLEMYLILPDGTESAKVYDPYLSMLDGKVFPFVCPQSVLGFRFKYSGVTSITSGHPLVLTVQMERNTSADGIIGIIKTNKELTIPIADWNEPNVVLISNSGNTTGGTCAARWIRDATGNQLWTIRNYTTKAHSNSEIELIKNPETIYSKYIRLTNPNSIELEYKIVTKKSYVKATNIPFNVSYLGCGRSIISPRYLQYVHNSYCICDNGYTYAIYHAKDRRSTEGSDTPENNVYLTIIKEGERIENTITIFSDREYSESYDGEKLDVVYNHSCVKFGRSILIVCSFHTLTKRILMYKTFDLDTWELSDIAPVQISYSGNSYDLTGQNYLAMVNSEYSKSYTYYSDGIRFPIHHIYNYNGTLYTVFNDAVGSDLNTHVPQVLMTSSDGETWEPVANLNEAGDANETIIAINDSKLLLIQRTRGNGMLYGVYGVTGTQIKAPTSLSAVESKSDAFVFQGNIYAIYNASPEYYSEDVYYRRLAINLAYLDDSDSLVTLKHYESEAGFQYFGVGIYGPRIRFVNTEDNGGVNLPESVGNDPVYGYGPYCQLSLSGISLDDVSIT